MKVVPVLSLPHQFPAWTSSLTSSGIPLVAAAGLSATVLFAVAASGSLVAAAAVLVTSLTIGVTAQLAAARAFGGPDRRRVRLLVDPQAPGFSAVMAAVKLINTAAVRANSVDPALSPGAFDALVEAFEDGHDQLARSVRAQSAYRFSDAHAQRVFTAVRAEARMTMLSLARTENYKKKEDRNVGSYSQGNEEVVAAA